MMRTFQGKLWSIFVALMVTFSLASLGYGAGDCKKGSAPIPAGPAAPPARTLGVTDWTTNTGGELDQYLGNSYGGCGATNNDNFITFTITVDQAISASSVLLTLSVWDVDYEATGSDPEIDKVYINGHYLGNLSGSNDAWSINTFTVPTSYLSAPGNNEVKVEVDTLGIAHQSDMWCVTVDYGTLSLSGSQASGVSLGNCSDQGIDSNTDGKYDKLNINIAVTASSSGSFNLNGALYDASNNLIGRAQTSGSLSQGTNTMTLEFEGEDINCRLANGPYKLRDVTVYDINNTNVRAFESELCTTSYYTYTQFATCTSTCPIVISTDPEDGAIGVPTSTTVGATFNVDMNGSTINSSTFSLAQGTLLAPVNGTVSYDSATKTATFSPAAALQPNTFYTATITTGAQSTSQCGLQYTKTWSFTTGTGSAGSGCIDPISISLSKTCGQVGEAVTITATGSDPGLKYKFFVGLNSYCDTSVAQNWMLLQDWSSGNTYTYTPTAEGRIIFVVWTAKDSNDPCTGIAGISYQAGEGGGPGPGGNASLMVTVVNATNANPLSGAGLSLGSQSGSTNASGVYTLSNLAAGSYTLTATLTGFITNTQSITLAAGESKEVTVALSPQLAAGEMRIVLTWGDTPSDLDSHLTGPDATGARFHVYYSDRDPGGGANLDVDDTTSYGPETVTISEMYAGTYKYYIHDYTNRYETSSSALAQSGAQVQVYRGSGLIATYNVPSQAGTLWYVFSMDGASGTITPQNQMMYESSPYGPSIESAGAETELFRNLPSK